MTKTKASTVSADRLKSFIERVERLLEERAGIQSDIKDIFTEAKSVGYDVKTMRTIIKLRAKDSADRAEEEALLDTYMVALGMSNGGGSVSVHIQEGPTEEELLEQAARVVTEVDRCEALAVEGKPPTIAAIQAELGCSLGKASKIRKLVEERISRLIENNREMKSGGQPEPAPADTAIETWVSSPLDTSSTESVGSTDGRASPCDATGDSRPATDAKEAEREEPVLKPGPTDTQHEDTLEIPTHLRRARA